MTRRPPFPPAAAGLPRTVEERLRGPAVLSPSVTVTRIGAAAARAVLAPAGRVRWLAVAGGLAAILAWLLSGTGPARAPFAAAGFGWWAGLASGCLTISGLVALARVDWRCGIIRLAQTAALLAALVSTVLACLSAALHPASADRTTLLMALSAVTVSAFGQWAAALVPDLADLRDRPEAQRVSWRAAFYRRAAAGWHGSSWQWFVWERACRALALVGILAAFALQTDLALTLAARTDRHDTLLPVALVVGAVLSGAGLIAMLAALLRREPGFDGFVTGRHLDILGRLILALGLAGLYCHVTEAVIAGLHGTEAERAIVAQRLTGAEAPAFWTLMLAGLLPTQALWVGAARRSAVTLGLVGALAALGAGAFHLLIVPSDLPSGPASPLPGLLAMAVGSAALFGLGLRVAFRLVPAVSIAELRGLALLHNRRPVALPPEGAGPPPRAGLAAAFASEAGLVEGLRGLGTPMPALHLDAYGPAPMPEAAAALRRDERIVREAALIGAVLAGSAFLLAQAAILAAETPGGLAALPALAWARLAIPTLSAAAAGGALGAAAALAWHLRQPAPEVGPPPDWREVFVLTLVPAADGPSPETSLETSPGTSLGTSLGSWARRLSALPEKAGRPLALRRAGTGRESAP
ncbi:DUF3341 domain-containing protein [Methylorubrum suomiense]|uniref:DUF3341 domain-containing protein n=1 Tax=Methylorubrum suomiense TaxID=144191 RepID=A0ABQ4UUX8_9HYPH|nr:DUF3341 domain-containing protein [Methylorubrum suomiense]GJE74792.1 hypothetical protein BGCPKDLD_1365 [Methylorubrum suomiense]